MEVIASVAGIGAVVAGFAALVFLWRIQEARRAERRALFDTEKQVHRDSIRRTQVTTVGLIALALVLLAVDVGGNAIANPPPTLTPTITPSPTPLPPTAGPSPTPTLTPSLTPTDTSIPPTATPQTATVIDAGTLGLRLRESPSVEGNLIDYLPDGTVVTLLDEITTTPDGIEWRRVIDPQGREGWVATLYIRINP